MRLAKSYGRWDVDRWLEEIEADDYAEQCALDQLEPSGWQALRILIRRISYLIVATVAGTKTPDEKHFDIVMGGRMRSEAAESARREALAIRNESDRRIAAQGDRGNVEAAI